jgi:hypothetical protein
MLVHLLLDAKIVEARWTLEVRARLLPNARCSQALF